METLFIGKNLFFLHEVNSTNTYAMNMLRNVNVIEGTLIHTDKQTEGKGQRGSVWDSAVASNITASIILKPHFLSIENTFYLSKISALAIYDVLTEILPSSQYDIKIKWPNDILVNKKKIAGILIESTFTQHYIQYSVIGIGLNVNQYEFNHLQDLATSLKLLMNVDFDRTIILENMCIHLEKWYLKLKEAKYEIIDDYYLKRLFGLNKLLDFINPQNRAFKAKVLGVTNDGKLMLEHQDITVKTYEVKEIKFEGI